MTAMARDSVRRTQLQDGGQARKSGAKPPVHRQDDAATYIAELLAELRNISRLAELPKLTLAIDAAYYEAYAVAELRRRPARIFNNTETTAG